MAAIAPALPFIGAGLSVVSAFGQMQAGKAAAKGLGQQAAMAQVQAKGEALKYKKAGVDTLKRIVQTGATLNARAAAGGIDPFSGSADALRQYASSEGAQEYFVTSDNQIIAREGGALQASLYQQQAKQAYRGGLFGAVSTLASAGSSFSKIGSAPTSGASSATRSYAPYQRYGGSGLGGTGYSSAYGGSGGSGMLV
tara:strand:- start:932 stop:1522 length:591 start_codon:yes stop_codon:yes gene_type:complete